MNIQSRYLKFKIPFSEIYKILNSKQYKRVIFHIDLASISRGFYNKQVIEYEIAEYVENKQLPSYFLNESKQFLNNLYQRFRQYNPMFNIFYDDGICKQNRSIYNKYKDRSEDRMKLIYEDIDMELFSNIKHYYYEQFAPMFTIPQLSTVTYLHDYEGDFLPWIVLRYNIWDSNNQNVLNIILSIDKDLLQCCQFKNVIQIFTLFSKYNNNIEFNIYDDENAINQLYSKAERGRLSSKYIPTLLALCGDKADKIPGIPKVGEANAYKLIINYNLPNILTNDFKWPSELEEYKDLIRRNYKLISFEEQLSRLPIQVVDKIKKGFDLKIGE